jgi:surfactin synthase thioesterase subunit
MSRDDLLVRRFCSSSPAEIGLVCFPHAGGAASYYYPLSQGLASCVEVLALQYPGRQDRGAEPCITNLPRLADHIVGELSFWQDRPLAFFGHSMGSIVAFEVARLLERGVGQGPIRLFASGYPAPGRLPGGSVHLRDDAGLVAELLAAGGTSPELLDYPDILQGLLSPMRGDYTAIETHSCWPDPPLACPVTALVGDHDFYTTAKDAQAWRHSTTGGFELHTYPGGHFYLDERWPDVTEVITRALTRPTM